MYYSVRCQLYTLNLFKIALIKLLHLKLTLTVNHQNLSRLSQLYYLTLKRLSKAVLVLIPLSLLPYSVNTQALSATTIQKINGSAPYLTFDNGVTKVTTADGLLGITLSDDTKITPATNTSTKNSPIVLPEANQQFTDINMVVPATTNSIALNTLIGQPYNYWADDDGDGQGTNGITATGTLSVSITDKDNQEVSRSTTLDVCQAPYKIVLTSTDVSLTTQYGLPNISYFTGNRATYYVSPKAEPKICYARPNLNYGTNSVEVVNWNFAGPANIWNTKKGFLVQSTESSSYDRNFPTAAANKLHFDLLAGGIDAATLTWPDVTLGGITATMTVNPPKSTPNQRNFPTFNPDGASSVRITLTGPAATSMQINTDYPTKLSPPSLPQTFEIVGYDSNHTAVLKYGFVLKHWFINRGKQTNSVLKIRDWCSKLGEAYRVPKVNELTNSVCAGYNSGRECQGVVGATPPSTQNNYQRNIGGGFFAEWGNLSEITESGFESIYYWSNDTSTLNSNSHYLIHLSHGYTTSTFLYDGYNGVCVYP
ncbi:hypothetical protein [Gilliamella sp. wkB112]|uniref:hypothetical protein n=1 Tax=Gilliamella sp. wkB112 TaxID=3120257 RepID=UPI00080DC487|nr:hypothetical protein [Gilliamella apicola]OCG05270.1 hypothetical protein A9G12_05965 [Gilliamella apicola]